MGVLRRPNPKVKERKRKNPYRGIWFRRRLGSRACSGTRSGPASCSIPRSRRIWPPIPAPCTRRYLRRKEEENHLRHAGAEFHPTDSIRLSQEGQSGPDRTRWYRLKIIKRKKKQETGTGRAHRNDAIRGKEREKEKRERREKR